MRALIIVLLSFFSSSVLAQGTPQQEIDSLLQVSKTTANEMNKAGSLQRLAWLHILKDTDAALRYNDSASKLYHQLNDKKGIADTDYKFAVINRVMGNYDQAMPYIDNYLDYIKEENDSFRLANALYQKGAIYNLKGDLDTALRLYYETLEIYLDFNDTLSAANIYNSIGVINKDLKYHDKAIDNYRNAIGLLKNSNRKNDLGNAYLNLSGIYMQQKEWDSTIADCNRALELFREFGNSYGIGTSLKNLGLANHKQGRINEGLKYYAEADKIFSENNYTKEQVENLVDMAVAYQDLGNLKVSMECYQKAMDLGAASKQTLQELYFGLHKLYDESSNPNKALEAYKEHIKYKDSIFQENRIKNINELEIKYETALKESRLAEQQLQLQDQENELLKRKTQYAYALTGGVLLLFTSLGLLLYFRQRQKLKNTEIDMLQQEKEINTLEAILQGEENERFRIAKDLHDGINGDLAAIKFKIATIEHGEISTADKKQYKEAMGMLDNAVEQVRLISHNLTPPSLQKFSLSEALEQFCTKLNASENLDINYQYFGTELELDKNTETTIYRLVQELVNNIAKHANATEAIVQLNNHGKYVQITVEDNGIGFDTKKSAQGIGLKNVKSRVQLLNAQMDIKSDTGGSTFTVDIHLDKLNQA